VLQKIGKSELQLVMMMAQRLRGALRQLARMKPALGGIPSLAGWHGYSAAGDSSNAQGSEVLLAGAARVSRISESLFCSPPSVNLLHLSLGLLCQSGRTSATIGSTYKQGAGGKRQD
jgi:hypothetical protein